MSSSLLSEPSTVKLFSRLRRPLTANCPAVPTPGLTPGPRVFGVSGGGWTPGASSANESKLRRPGTGSDSITRGEKT